MFIKKLFKKGIGPSSYPYGGYVGPGDVPGYSGAYAYWGLRGYTAAIASTGTQNAVDLVDQTGANSISIKILPNGNLDVASINAWVTANSVTTIRVAQLYDQSGNNRHLNTAPFGANDNRPVLIMSGVGFGSIPVMEFESGAPRGLLTAGNAATQTLPFTLSAVTRNPTFVADGRIFSNGTSVQAGAAAAASSFIFAGSNIATAGTVPDTQWGALQEVFRESPNGASSTINSANAGTNPSATPATVSANPGTNGLGNSAQMGIGVRITGTNVGDLPYNGYIFEMMIIPSAASPANQALQSANQRAYGGNF